jgi:uncharacterized C2H2 Zn-finger protein
MIPLQISTILALYVAIPLAVLFLLALFYALRTRHHSIREKESIYQCAQCGHVYAFARDRPMDRCPRCNHLNEAVRS